MGWIWIEGAVWSRNEVAASHIASRIQLHEAATSPYEVGWDWWIA